MTKHSAIFKWRQSEPEIILCAVRWYLRYSLSLRNVEELLAERGLSVDHTTVWHWVQRFAPELEQRMRRHLKPTNKSWRLDETYIRVKGRWCYLYRAIDSAGAPFDFLLSALRNADAAKRLFRSALKDLSHPQAACHQYGSGVVQAAREEARVLLRSGDDFVWNATNLSREIRGQIVDLLTAYDARIKIVYVEASHDVLFAQNGRRNAVVPVTAIERMMDRWEVPDRTEAHQVEWWVDERHA